MSYGVWVSSFLNPEVERGNPGEILILPEASEENAQKVSWPSETVESLVSGSTPVF